MNITPLHIHTPTFHSLPLTRKFGCNIYLKMECLQPVGSYKIRGIGRLCQYYIDAGYNHLVSSSGGNAGLAVAYAGRKLSVMVDVFVPTSTHQIYIEAIKKEGATVHVQGEVWDDANDAAKAYVAKVNGAFIPPFDHPLIWSGHATMIDEVVACGIKPDAVVVAVGGGGLCCGVLQGMHNYGWDESPVFTVETEGAASLAASLAAGKLVKLDKITTIATSLGAKQVTTQLLEWSKQRVLSPLIVSDADAVLACQRFANDHRVFVEPSSGAALSVIYDQEPQLKVFKNILVIVCGGVGISLELLQNYLKMFNLV